MAPSTPRSSTGSGGCSRTRPAARCRSSAVGGQGGDRRVSAHPPGPAAARRAPPPAPACSARSRRPPPAAAQLGGEHARSALLVVLPLVRADHVKAFEDDARRHAEPQRPDREVAALRPRGAGVDARAAGAPHAHDRHALVPVPRLAAARGLPAVPGYNPVWDWQPVLTEVDARRRRRRRSTSPTTRSFAGPRFPDVRRPAGRPPQPARRGAAHRHRPELRSRRAATAATERTTAGHRGAARAEARRAPSSSASTRSTPVDARRPADLRAARRVDNDGIGPDGRPAGGAAVLRRRHRQLRDAYASTSRRSTRVGRLMDEVPDDTPCSCSATSASRSASTTTSAAARRPRTALLRDPVPDPPPGRREGRRRRRLVRLHARRGADAAVLPGPHDPRQDARRGPHRAVRRRGRGGPAGPALLDHRGRLADHGPRQPLADGGRPRADRAAPLRRRRGGRRRHHALRRRRQRRRRAC